MFVVADGFRKKTSWFTGEMWAAYSFHAVFAVLGFWLLQRAVGA